MQVNWAGASGASYAFSILQEGNVPLDVAGLYIFARSTPQGWQAIYIGQAGSLAARVTSSHEKFPAIWAQGYTHVHLMAYPGGEDARRRVEGDLIARWRPVCNVQGV